MEEQNSLEEKLEKGKAGSEKTDVENSAEGCFNQTRCRHTRQRSQPDAVVGG
jgi:hypothetical protein